MLRVECFGSSLPQDGPHTTVNQDAFIIGGIRPIYWMALADGAGNAQNCATRSLRMFEERIADVSLAKMLRDDTWTKWVKSMDSALTGGPQSTFVGAAVVGDEIIGVSAGDSRAYLIPFGENTARILTSLTNKERLGSGDVKPHVFHTCLQPRDVVLLCSDGVWTILGNAVEAVVKTNNLKNFADMPTEIINHASKRGRADDMTAVVLRLMRS